MTDARIPIMAQECCEHTESLGELRLICDRLLARLENVEERVAELEEQHRGDWHRQMATEFMALSERVGRLEAQQRISYTEPPSFIVTESTKVWVEP